MFGHPVQHAARHSAFTLVEIAVVMAIACLLATILLPVFSRARSAARASTCRSNLRQIGMASEQYLADSGQIYLTQDQTPGHEYCFAEILQPYLKNEQVFLCPSASSKLTTIEPPSTDHEDYTWKAGRFQGTYAMNGMLQNLNVSLVRQPSITVAFLDDRIFGDIGYNAHLPYCGRHSNGVNVYYADGHVKWIGLTQAANLNFFP